MLEMRFEDLAPVNLVGVSARMSYIEDATPQLWRTLMPRRGEIPNRTATSYISMRIYEPAGMSIEQMFAPDTVFEKWAAVEVSEFGLLPDGIRTHTIAGGRYAVFLHKSGAGEFANSMRYIFSKWLPSSGYRLDDREQFERVPAGWRADDPKGQEEIWIPLRERDDA